MKQLSRFQHAQRELFAIALVEIQAGKKQGHWIWYIFPQIFGLGRSANSQYYAITDMAEAKNYLADPVLSSNLATISNALLSHKNKNINEILGELDAQKVQACMTLFLKAGASPYPQQVLDTFYQGQLHEPTLLRLSFNKTPKEE